MKNWVVRFASLYVFNIVVLLVIGLFTPARIGFHAIWAAVIMTLAELFVKPIVHRAFSNAAAKSAGQRTRAGEGLVQGGIVLVVAAIVWVITLLLSRASLGGSLFWAWVLPPVIIAIGWFVYARIDARVQAAASDIYDRAEAGIRGQSARPGAAAPPSPAAAAGREELKDGLTPEQRRMLDELG
ncbi:SND2/TMEM208 family protein [Microbacterium sp. No. 7]|uniref:SND2/TMEM208 family protein n=1 Tax=Microbacterium sp. No. 7 TaxID=1714373 RepID=UPI0006D06D2B|nr:SND2/TMEM208 family protein [Microbacterium sp. No. 7]ALJ19213.1 hypothetical protein AOA12_04585 [Microbacterium sp. No. 7]